MSNASSLGNLVVYGAGGHGLVVADAAARAGFAVVGLVDDAIEPGTTVGAWPVLAEQPDEPTIVAMGDNATRATLIARLVDEGVTLRSVVHPSATVSSLAEIGDGVYIGPGAIVNAEAMVGIGAIINSGSIVEHHVQVREGAHLAPGATLCGSVQVGGNTLIGAGAVVLPGVSVGDGVIVGAGSVVREEVQSGQTVVGNPARPMV